MSTMHFGSSCVNGITPRQIGVIISKTKYTRNWTLVGEITFCVVKEHGPFAVAINLIQEGLNKKAARH